MTDNPSQWVFSESAAATSRLPYPQRQPDASAVLSPRSPRERQEKVPMDKNRIIGAAKEAMGAVKQAIGKATGDTKLQADGNADRVEGKVQNAVGGLNDTVRDALKK
jgi:uncharacterized protein YjbJ (UPF0337 family)